MKLLRIVFSIMMALMIYVIGGCSDEDVVERCKDNDMIPIGEYLLVNDITYPCTPNSCYPLYTQCIFEDPRENTYGWTWAEIPEYSGGWTSAYVHYGGKWIVGDRGSTTPALPVPIVDTTSITIDYDALVSTTSEYRLRIIAGYDRPGYAKRFSEFLEIEVDSASSNSPENFQKRVTIDGEEYDYYYEEFYFYSSVTVFEITYSFVKIVPTHTGTLRLHKFLDFLRDNGYSGMERMERIDYIQFSQSIRGGAGSTTIRNFSVEVK